MTKRPKQLLVITLAVGAIGLVMHVFTSYMDYKLAEWLEEGVYIPLSGRIGIALASTWKQFRFFYLLGLWLGAFMCLSLWNEWRAEKSDGSGPPA